MKTPPLLLLATLLFWGWQSQLLLYGALVGLALEAARVFKPRWELEDMDFNRIWSFCALILVALGAYVFTTNEAGGGLSGMFQGASGLRNATASSSVATTSVLRWLPLIFSPFLAAQIYNVRPTVPLTAVSLVLRLRRRRGEQALAGRYVDVTYPYFMVCLFSAGIHSNRSIFLTYFCGQLGLILWALWTVRSGRFGARAWALGLAAILMLGLAGLAGIGRLELAVQNFDAQMISRLFRSHTDPFQSMTAIGQIGELKLSPRIVIRLEPAQVGVVPDYLREASYWTYSPANQIWKASTASNSFEDVIHAPAKPDTTWLLVPGKTNSCAVGITAYLNGHTRGEDSVPEGLLPLPSGCGRLEKLPAFTLKVNKTGAVLATGPGLVIFDALYGPGATDDSPPDTSTNQFDLSVPPTEAPALSQVVAELNLTNASASDADKRRAVETFFAQKFTYSLWQGPEKRGTANASPLTRFLLKSRSGHCEYFATATVLLLRQLGIPARYAVGYSVHEVSGSSYVVRERDAHAWCLVWNQEARVWEDFDTTPASWVAMEGRRAAILDALSDLRSWLVLQVEKLRWGESHFQQYIPWMFIPVILVLLYYILFQRRTRGRTAKKPGAEAAIVWPGHDSAFYRLEKSLAARGLPRQPQETLSDWLERVLAEPALAGQCGGLRELLQLHYRYRFDPRGLNDLQKQSLAQNAEALLQSLAQLKPGK